MTDTRRLIPLTLVLLFTSPCLAEKSPAELAAEVAALEARVRMLESRIAALTARVESEDVVVTGRPAAQPASASTDPVEPTIKLGGRVKVDLIVNSPSTGKPGGADRADTAFTPGAIPLSGEGEDGQLTGSARDSRFFMSARTPTRHGELDAYIEIDFASSDQSGNERVSNSYNPRLRHAYGSYKNFTVGQTYTTFLNTLAYPELNDAIGPVGIHLVRQPQIRYQVNASFGTVSLAMEQPETTLTMPDGARLVPDDDRLPDLVGRVDFNDTWGTWSIAGLVRQLRSDGALVPGVADSSWAGAASASGRLYVGDSDNLRFAATWGRGTGRYVSLNVFHGGAIDATGRIESIETVSGYIAYQHWWSNDLRTNFALGYARADLDAALVPPGVNESFASTHLNLIWNPVPNATLGVEWLHGTRNLLGGEDGKLNRFQLTSLYKF